MNHEKTQKYFKHFLNSAIPAYLAAVNAACERAPIIHPRAVSDGQFYSPPESVAGELFLSHRSVLLEDICFPSELLMESSSLNLT